MKKLISIISLLLLTNFAFSQIYKNDIQFGISGGALISSKPGVGLQATGELKIDQCISVSYRALTSAGGILFMGVSNTNNYSEQALLFGFHLPLGKSKFSAFVKAGPSYYKLQTTSSAFLLFNESANYSGSTLAAELGASYEHKALDIHFMIGKTNFESQNKNPFIMGARIGFDPLYWILPQQKKSP